MKQSQWPSWNEIHWPTALFLILTPLIGLVGTGVAIWIEGFSWGMLAFSLVFAALTNLSITTGYHRLFSHRSYEAHPVVKWVLVLIGTGAWQASVLKWCSDHREHHTEIDGENDPYSIQRGFWYAHMGWMLFKEKPGYKIHCPDLEKDALLQFQHRHYIKCAIAVGFLLPLIVGAAFGYPLTGLMMAGALRIGLTQQSTFFVNSLCHTLGKQTYSTEISARDSLFVAFLTHGEGYHNFHHRFQYDYRNGIRWWQWDPTKWTIQCLAGLGLAWKLKTVPAIEILKARLQRESLTLNSRGYSMEKLEALREQIIRAQIRIRQLREESSRMKKQLQDSSWEKLAHAKAEIALAKVEFRAAFQQWKVLLRSPVVVRG